MVLVTVNCAPITAGALVESIQFTGGVKLGVDSSVNPATVAGQERISSFPLDLEFSDTGITSPMPMSATVCRGPAAIAVTPLCAAKGAVAWSSSFCWYPWNNHSIWA
ncbi:MAG: hypothetical protein ABI651_09860 [Verrucomicrobiota bacterium]